MLKKLSGLLVNNFGLKILAVAFAIVMWLVVVNVDDPKITRTFTTTVTIENASSITDMGKYYEVVDEKNTVTFSVLAKRSLIEDLSSSDFKAVADMSNIENMSQVPIEVTALHYASQISIVNRTQYLQVTVEDLQSQSFIITAEDTGTPADGSVVGDISVSPNVLKVSGPASVIASIDKVVATIDVTGMSTDISENVIPKMYDSDGNEVDTTEITSNISAVTVSAEILNTKTIALNFNTTGEPADGYQMTNITYSPENIKIKGAADVLNKLDFISIPEDVLDISSAKGDLTKTVDISSYIPNGVSLVDSAQKNVEVTVEIEEASSKKFDMPTANITVNNLTSGYDADFSDETVEVTIVGFESDLNELSADKLTGSIDASGLKLGDHTVTLTLDLSDTYATGGTQTVKVTIVKSKNTSSSTTTGTSSGSTASGTSSSTGTSDSTGTTSGSEGTAGETAGSADDAAQTE